MESVVASLKEEDPSVQKTLEGLGLSQEKIEEIIAFGYTVDSVLDVELISKSKK